jgi:hypothetical protein
MPATSSMLFSNVSSPQRRVIVQQQHLVFPDIPSPPHDAVWAQLDNEQRAAVVEVLARLLVQMKLPHEALKEITDD